jgi:hypothetical protein
MFNISKVPVLILSTPRTGSSALGSYLCSIIGKDMTFFNEPDFALDSHMPVFENYYKNSNRFILKLHAFNTHLYRKDIIEYLTTSDDVYRISISRKNVVEQIASYYIAQLRDKKFHYNFKHELSKYDDIVSLDIHTLNVCIKKILEANMSLEKTSVKFNEHVFYEDIPDMKVVDTSWWRESQENAEFFKTPKPKNYDELCKVIRALM